MKYIFSIILTLLFHHSFAVLHPTKLTCEYRENPLGIDMAKPRFSWQFVLEGRSQNQSAYEIIVSDREDDRTGNQWNSGKIGSGQSLHIEYKGSSLKSFTKYFWRVRVYDVNDTASEWSDPATFETAMLSISDWTAKWIDDGRHQFERDEDFYKDDRMPLFKKSFVVKKTIQSARLYIAGLGYYEAYLNGKKIGDHVLDPGWTTYRKEVLYVAHDITHLLKNGDNVAGVMLGNGWYNPLPMRLFSRFNLRDAQETGRPCLKAEIRIQYEDGSIDSIVTDETWQTALGPVLRNNVYLGEHFDARLEQKDWLTATTGKAWKNAVLTKGPSGTLSVQMQPPIRITKVLKPISVKELKPGVFIADMGQNFAGAARIKVKGKAGTQIKLKYGENIHPDGSLNFLTSIAGQIKSMWKVDGGPGAPADAWQEDRYTLKGVGTEVWAPRFTFHGFRYVEITGWPGKPDLNSIEGLRMNTDLASTGDFTCSNEMFNQLHSVINWTFLSNVFSVQSDCPGREKFGYGADITATCNSFNYNFDMASFYRKAVSDFADEQQPDGGITETAPFVGIADRGYGGNSGPLGWQLAFPYLQKQLFTFYGDKKIIEDHFPAIKKQMEFLQANSVDGLFHWDISDHEALDPRPEAFSASAFYYHHALLAAEFATILDKREDKVAFTKLAEQIKELIVQKYLVPNTGRFDNATQSAQLFALWYDVSPEKELTFEILMNEFKRYQNHISSGIFGVMMMFDVLRQTNNNELAYTIANQRGYPGWGYMLSNGATTLWENWKGSDNVYSQNHPMFGSVDEWFYRSLLGINPAAPGFEKIVIKPQPAGDLTWAKGSYHSVRGKIGSDWKIENGKYTLRVSIPANTTSEVWIKCMENSLIMEKEKEVKPDAYENGYALIRVGSGEFVFEVKL
ncbi:MAG: family 78 glycoside hydrolase catalytic domain [Bacteroidota bacterium]